MDRYGKPCVLGGTVAALLVVPGLVAREVDVLQQDENTTSVLMEHDRPVVTQHSSDVPPETFSTQEGTPALGPKQSVQLKEFIKRSANPYGTDPKLGCDKWVEVVKAHIKKEAPVQTEISEGKLLRYGLHKVATQQGRWKTKSHMVNQDLTVHLIAIYHPQSQPHHSMAVFGSTPTKDVYFYGICSHWLELKRLCEAVENGEHFKPDLENLAKLHAVFTGPPDKAGVLTEKIVKVRDGSQIIGPWSGPLHVDENGGASTKHSALVQETESVQLNEFIKWSTNPYGTDTESRCDKWIDVVKERIKEAPAHTEISNSSLKGVAENATGARLRWKTTSHVVNPSLTVHLIAISHLEDPYHSMAVFGSTHTKEVYFYGICNSQIELMGLCEAVEEGNHFEPPNLKAWSTFGCHNISVENNGPDKDGAWTEKIVRVGEGSQIFGPWSGPLLVDANGVSSPQ